MDTLAKLEEENKKLQKIISDKSEMISLGAHQIKTSLAGLKWILKMYIDGDLGKLSAEQENLMKKAYDSNERAITVINELLLSNTNKVSQEKGYVFTKVNLIDIIDRAIFDFSGETHAKDIEIIFLKTEIKSHHVRADAEQLFVAVQNIIENAIKYSDMHSKVFITLKEEGDVLQISVKNRGTDISEEGNQRLFEKFFRDKEAIKKVADGTGIGLFTSKNIIEKCGGEIWFESNKDEGTTFSFTVPIFK